MSTVSSTVGGSTTTVWNRRSSAPSFSMYLRYSFSVDAPTHTQALAVQERNRERFQRAFAEGLSVLGYERDGRGNGRFLLGEWNEGWRYWQAAAPDSL